MDRRQFVEQELARLVKIEPEDQTALNRRVKRMMLKASDSPRNVAERAGEPYKTRLRGYSVGVPDDRDD